MKKRILLSAFLVFSLLATSTALAQTTTEEPAPVIEQSQPIEDQDTVFDMIGSGWNTAMDGITDSWNGMTDTIVGGWNSKVNAIVDTTTGGWNAVVDTVTGGKDAVTGTLSEWQASVESYMQEKNWTEDVKNAWNTLKQGAADAGSVTKEQAESAYYTVRNWFAQTGETIDQGYAAVIDKMASEAGVAEATVSDWFRTVDSYINDSVNQASESVLEAWNIVKQGTLDMNSVAEDQFESAKRTVLDWFSEQNVSDDTETSNAVEEIMNLMSSDDDLIVNSYDNTDELIQKFPVINETPVEEGIGKNIQNRLLTGFENWNRGFDAWKAWGDILYTPDSIYNVHGARLTLAEYQAAMDITLKQVNIQMGNFNNMIICDNWTAIRYDIFTTVGENTVPGAVMEFVNFADYGEDLGTRVVEGWGGPKDDSYTSMTMFQGDEEKAIQQEQIAALLAYEIPDTDDLAEKYPVLYPTTDNSEMADDIREALLKDIEHWNQGTEAWTEWADTFYTADAVCTDGMTSMSLSDYKDVVKANAEIETEIRKYFDSMLISGDWAATHYRIVTENLETGEKTVGDHMQFYHFEKTEDDLKVTESWLS